MKLHSRFFLSTSLLLSFYKTSHSQENTLRPDKFYTMSSAGLSFPVGGSSAFMRPKFSTTLGANIGIGDGRLFLYPKVSLHVFGYDNPVPDHGFIFELQRGRATTYLLNLALGYRQIVGKFAFYGFFGAGGGFVLTPRVEVNDTEDIAVLTNKTNRMGIIEPGAGIEYNIGGANVFIESSYMYGLNNVGNRPFNAIPFTIGIKPNLSRLFYKNKE